MRLSDTKHRDLKIKAIKDDVSVQGFIEEVISTYLNSDISAKELIEKISKK